MVEWLSFTTAIFAESYRVLPDGRKAKNYYPILRTVIASASEAISNSAARLLRREQLRLAMTFKLRNMSYYVTESVGIAAGWK